MAGERMTGQRHVNSRGIEKIRKKKHSNSPGIRSKNQMETSTRDEMGGEIGGLPKIVCIIIEQGNGWKILASHCLYLFTAKNWAYSKFREPGILQGLVVSGNSCQYYMRHHSRGR